MRGIVVFSSQAIMLPAINKNIQQKRIKKNIKTKSCKIHVPIDLLARKVKNNAKKASIVTRVIKKINIEKSIPPDEYKFGINTIMKNITKIKQG